MNTVTMTINGARISQPVEPRLHLADFVRENLNLTGTHIGCEHGVCGACTMLVDGRPTRSCITFAATCSGAEVRTVEGFGDDPVMAALRTAFNRHHALQCGYCTPGFLATAYDIVTRLPDADDDRVREELAGNLCRCTGYAGIVAAIRSVLDTGAPEPLFRPVTRPALAPQEAGTAASVRAKPATPSKTHADASLPPLPETLDNPVVLNREIPVSVPVDRLWATIQDIGTVARCLPGASIEEQHADGLVLGAFLVAIGPMKATFRGRAKVEFNPAQRTGRVIGSGGDPISRSKADGAISFTAEAMDAASSRVAVEIAYKLTGPLSQFGRPAVVADIVDRLLERFATNLAQAAEGHEVQASAPIGGIGFMLRTVWSLLGRILSSRRG
ncbi:xanthine dehydrogenase family Fe-S subunit [Terrihabitans sp. B22-R8]|uniref:xanthine dehydrogenase family Fe-S subunit n=1 Tax=Terrihabitans sp. B22-R8 TaxID=3425128 RepID=UPI00403C548D